MKKILLLIICCIFSGSAQGQVIISNDFGPGADVGPGLQLLTNNIGGPGTFDPTTGVVATFNGTNNNNTTGFNNVALAAVDPLATAISAEFVVSSADTTALDANGFFFGLVTGTNATDPTGDGLFNNDPGAIGILLENDNAPPPDVLFVQDPDGGATLLTSSLLGAGFPTAASLANGFTLNFTVFDDNTFTASSVGLSNDFTQSGALDTTGTFPVFADFLAGGVGVNASIQGDNGTQNFTIDSFTVSVTTPPAVPELTSLALLFGGALVLASKRRRAI